MKPKICPHAGSVRWDEGDEYPADKHISHSEAGEGMLPSGIKRIRVKCPVCKRKMLASFRVCGDGCCLMWLIPPHKRKGWWKKKPKKRKDRKKGRRRRVN